MPLPPNLKHRQIPAFDSTIPGPLPQEYIPSPLLHDSITSNLTLPPGDAIIPQTRDDYNIMTETPYQLRVDYDRNLAMLTKPEIDLKLVSINPNVFDRIQKVVDTINEQHGYINKTKTLLGQLEYYQELRKYETVIRRATNLTVDTEPLSLEKLQERVCTDPWLALFFKKANETRNMKVGKKLTMDTWKMTKQIIIAYYLNFFLFQKKQCVIKNSKLSSFAVNCLRMRPNTHKFNDFCVFELMVNNGTLAKNDGEDLNIPDAYLEKTKSYEGDMMRFGEYSDIFNLAEYCETLYNDDDGNADIKQALSKEEGGWRSSLTSRVSGLISWTCENPITATAGIVALAELAGATIIGTSVIGTGISLGLNYVPWAYNKLSNTPVANNLYNYGLNTFYYPAMSRLGVKDDDGAIISSSTTKTTPYLGSTPVSIGRIKKVGDKYIQSGYFYTICVFIDEALENCMSTFVAKNGPINWGKPVENDVVLDFKNMMECHKQRQELIQYNRLVVNNTERGKIDTMINEMRKNSYEAVRKEIDISLLKQLDEVIDDATQGKKNTYKNQSEVDNDKSLAQQWYNALFDKTGDTKYKAALALSWTYRSNVVPTYADGTSRPSAWKDGGHVKSPKTKKRDGYKRSPEYDGLKKAYKDGKITKDGFKDAKSQLKQRSRKR